MERIKFYLLASTVVFIGCKKSGDDEDPNIIRIETDLEISDFIWKGLNQYYYCLLYTSPSPRDRQKSRMPSSA